MDRPIVVTGAPGNVGSEVMRGLAAVGAVVRVAAFDVEAAQREFGGTLPAGAVVPFDFAQPTTFEAAFANADRLFLVRPPALSNVERDIAPAVRAAVAAGVRHIVFLSLQGVEQNRMVPHYKIEKLILGLGVHFTFLRASFFMQNLSTTHRAEIRDRGEIALPAGGARTSFIDARDIAAAAVLTLTQPGHENQRYTLTGGEALTYDEVAGTLSRELGRPVRYTNPSLTRFFRQRLAEGWSVGYTLVVAGLYTITRLGNAAATTPDLARLLGRPPIRFAQYARDYRAAWLGAGTPRTPEP